MLVDDETPWVRDYRGLWGLDTGDPFGGERAPAGPRYERGGSVRLCWSDPVGWAGLDKEAPSPAAERQAIQDRITELDASLTEAAANSTPAATNCAAPTSASGPPAAAGRRTWPRLAALEAAVQQARSRRQTLTEERDALERAARNGLPWREPHAHLQHRAVPNVDPARSRSRVLRVWSTVSASFLLAGLAVVIIGQFGALLPTFGGLALVMLCLEAFARGHLRQFVTGLLAAAIAGVVAWLIVTEAVGNWRPAVAALLILAAVVLLGANIRDFFVKR